MTESPSPSPSPSLDEAKLHAFLQRALNDLSAGYGGVMVSLGRQLGLYQAMAGAGPLRSQDLASRTGCAERYVREWLNSQVAGEYVHYHASDETYELLPEQAAVLADEESSAYVPSAWESVASMWFDESKALEAFRTGRGVSWNDHHERLYCGVAAFFRNAYRGQLVSHWLPALDGMVEKLRHGATVADIGCGHGHSTILMAQAFPASQFHGIDPHPASLAAGRENARAGGVADRVTFSVGTAKTLAHRHLDLICFFDCLHDMGDPVGAACRAREALAPDGMVMAVEPFARDRVEDNINPISRIYYSASTTMCCAHSLSEEVGLALGAQAGQSRLEAIFREAGFSRFRIARETPFNLIIEARP